MNILVCLNQILDPENLADFASSSTAEAEQVRPLWTNIFSRMRSNGLHFASAQARPNHRSSFVSFCGIRAAQAPRDEAAPPRSSSVKQPNPLSRGLARAAGIPRKARTFDLLWGREAGYWGAGKRGC